MVTLEMVREAQDRISAFAKRTSLVRSDLLSRELGTNIYLKLELFQKTGAFKVRGALNKMLSLRKDGDPVRVVTFSGGNHAQAVAYVAGKLGVKARIFMAATTPANCIEATREYGAEVELKSSMDEILACVQEHERQGWVSVHPFDDPLVVAGQGTMGLEILEQLPQVTDVIASVGGGGMIGGVSTALKSFTPRIRIWGVETDGAQTMTPALALGRVVRAEAITSIAKTLGPPYVSELTLKLAQKHLEAMTVVTDAEAFASVRLLLERAKILVEPAAGCTLAAARRLRHHFSTQQHVVLILCGGNVSLTDLIRFDQLFPSN